MFIQNVVLWCNFSYILYLMNKKRKLFRATEKYLIKDVLFMACCYVFRKKSNLSFCTLMYESEHGGQPRTGS